MREFMPTLTRHTKWTIPQRILRPDDVVLLIHPATQRGTWPLGRIIKTCPVPDGVVHLAFVRTGLTMLHRPTVKLCLLEPTTDENVSGKSKTGPAMLR